MLHSLDVTVGLGLKVLPFYVIKISKMTWYREYPAGIESWKFLFPQSVVKILLLNEKIINKTKKKLADLRNKNLAKFWCFNVDNKILLFISGCSHFWCESQFFDYMLLVLFNWWSPDSKLVSLWTRILQYSSSGVLLQIPNSSPEQELLHAAAMSWFTSEVTSFYDRLSKYFLIIILY